MTKVEFIEAIVPMVDDELKRIPLVQAIAESDIGKHPALRKMYIKPPSNDDDGMLWLMFWSEHHQRHVDVKFPILPMEYRAAADEVESIAKYYATVAASSYDYLVETGPYWGRIGARGGWVA